MRTRSARDEPVRLRVVARAGAELEININGRDYGTPVAEETSVQGTEETFIFDITAHTKEGENTVAVRYADSNGYPTEATNGTQASLTLRRDLTAPQFHALPADHHRRYRAAGCARIQRR